MANNWKKYGRKIVKNVPKGMKNLQKQMNCRKIGKIQQQQKNTSKKRLKLAKTIQ